MPGAAPINVSANGEGPFKVFVEWIRVERDDMNGVPLGYKIYSYLNNILQNTSSVNYYTQSIIIGNLIPGTRYVFEVCAFNKLGNGPCDKAIAVTLNSRKLL